MQKKTGLMGKLTKFAGIPTDIISKMPRLTFEGNTRLLVDNHQGIVTYRDDTLEIKIEGGLLRVKGHGFELDAIGIEGITVSGFIDCAEFLLEGEK